MAKPLSDAAAGWSPPELVAVEPVVPAPSVHADPVADEAGPILSVETPGAGADAPPVLSEASPSKASPAGEGDAGQDDAPYLAGFAEGSANGFAKGFEEGRAHAEALVAEMQALLDAFAAPFADSDATLLHATLDLACRVAAAVVRRELQTDPAVIEAVVADAMAVLGEVRGDVELALHPQDLQLCQELGMVFDARIQVRENPQIERGGLLLRGKAEFIDATVAARLQAVVAALYEQAGLPEPAHGECEA